MKTLQTDVSRTFAKAWNDGMVCLHPTDTLPGLSFHPEKPEALIKLLNIKGNRKEKNFVSLVANFEKALKFWQPLPGNWRQKLSKIWPAPLSICWRASSNAPACLVSESGLIALRVPALSEESSWLSDCLENFDDPLPTTSVNVADDKPCATWDDAVKFAEKFAEIFIPSVSGSMNRNATELSSTLIELKEDGDIICLRDGGFKL